MRAVDLRRTAATCEVMGKLVVLIIVAIVAYVVVQALAASRRGQGRNSARDKPDPNAGERVVPCSECGVNVPESEALVSGGRYFCSDAHLRQHCQ